MTKEQRIGIGISAIGSVVYYCVENDVLQTISGILCAIGLSLVLKLIAFKKQNLSKYFEIKNQINVTLRLINVL